MKCKRDLFRKVWNSVSAYPSVINCSDLLSMCRESILNGTMTALPFLKKMCNKLSEFIPSMIESKNPTANALISLHRESLKLAAPYDFDSYIQFMEWNREAKKRFYLPRRKQLLQVVESLQDLADDKLDLLAISLPPGVGKTTLAIFYLTWIAGRNPEKPNITASHSNQFIRGVYDECLRMMDENGEYLWHEVFPNTGVCNTNAKDCRIDVGYEKRFETLEFTSIGSSNAGLYRAENLLYCDDLVSGIEVALSIERLNKLWTTYTTDLRQRKIGACKELHIATRWSVHDVIGRLEEDYGDDDRARFITVPAMNKHDESNFDYKYGVGFSTNFYKAQRKIMDSFEWKALYMNEPIEREGLLYDEDTLRRFYDLPAGEPDAVIGVCDTKDRGTDYAVLPVAYVYGDDYYIADCLCDNGLVENVDIKMTDIILSNKIGAVRFESNSAGGRVAKDIDRAVKEKGGYCNITTKYTTANKETKIIVNSKWVKEHCLFWNPEHYTRQSDYGKFMNMLCSYTVAGKNKHDDAPDAIAMLSEFAQSFNKPKVRIFERPF